MSEMLPQTPNACAIACPTAAARTLGELSRQYQPPEQWLFSSPEERPTIGLFSVDAVRTVLGNYHVGGPADHPRYGTPREYVDMDQVTLGTMQRSIQRGHYITPEEVTGLDRMANERTRQRNEFAALPTRDQQRRAVAAKPFLDEVAITLLDKNPEFAEMQELASILANREEKNETLSLARDLVAATKNIDRLYALDQGPFLVARQAVQACVGPLAYNVPRFAPFGYPLGTKTGTVCPNGSQRNDAYFNAIISSEQQVPNS